MHMHVEARQVHHASSCITLFVLIPLRQCLSLNLELTDICPRLGWPASGSVDFSTVFLLPCPLPQLNAEPNVCTASSTYPLIQLFILLIQSSKAQKSTRENMLNCTKGCSSLEASPYPTLIGILSFSLIGLHSLCIKNITQRKAIIPPVNSNSCAIGYCDSGAGLAYLLCAVECQPPAQDHCSFLLMSH